MSYEETRHEARANLIGYAAIALFGGLLVFMAHAYNRELQHEIVATAAAEKWSETAAQGNALVTQLESERDMLQAQLDELAALAVKDAALPSQVQTGTWTVRIDPVAQPCVEPDPVPVFSRDSQFIH